MNKRPPDNSSSVTHKRFVQSPGCNELNAFPKLEINLKQSKHTSTNYFSKYVEDLQTKNKLCRVLGYIKLPLNIELMKLIHFLTNQQYNFCSSS